jgi:hypothetical protein
MSADFEQVMAQCSKGCFTGLLRVRTREGSGEVRFLSGIQDGIRFDSVEGDAALERLQAASDLEFEAISSLPPIDQNSKEPVPIDGRLERFHAAQLMRYCENNSLTCALELDVDGTVLTARYRLGDLLSVEPDSEHTARLAEAKVGIYRFRLPRFELPANVQQRRSGPPSAAKPVPPKTAPLSASKVAASALAETPLVGLRPVSVGGGSASTAKAPAVAAKAPAASSPAPVRPAAPGGPVSRPASDVRPPSPTAPSRPAPARPAASTSQPPGSRREEAPRQAPKPAPAEPRAVARGPEARPAAAHSETPVMPLVHPKPFPAATAPASAAPAPRVPRSPVPPAPAAAGRPAALESAVSSPVSSAPVSPAPKSVPLEGLWKDAVKPPAQSAPVELETGAARALGSSQPARAAARTEGLSSIVSSAEEQSVSSRRQGASVGYWLVALALLLAVAVVGWLVFGR